MRKLSIATDIVLTILALCFNEGFNIEFRLIMKEKTKIANISKIFSRLKDHSSARVLCKQVLITIVIGWRVS